MNNLSYADVPTLIAESEEEPKILLIKAKREIEKYGLKFSIQKTKIMASCPITSWQIYGGKVETVSGFIFLGPKINVYGDCSPQIIRHLLFGRKSTKCLNKVLKSSYITFLTKVHIIKAVVFPVVMYEYESWTIKKAKNQRNDAFKLWF